jgi:NhaA family Na+:H+ antiporter
VAEPSQRGFVNLLQEFSIPLLLGVAVAMLAANLAPVWYEHAIHWKPFGPLQAFGHELTLHFLVNDIFMVLFFGIAAKEITESCLPGGSLNPPSKAVNPLLATIGGVVGPILVFFVGLWLLFETGVYQDGVDDAEALARGWGVPTATDIALAWLVARTVFGRGHPAVDFLLLLAVADDAIGLVIIAVFYGDPLLPAEPKFLLLLLGGMAWAFTMRRLAVNHWLPYVWVGGLLAWSGLVLAHLHSRWSSSFRSCPGRSATSGSSRPGTRSTGSVRISPPTSMSSTRRSTISRSRTRSGSTSGCSSSHSRTRACRSRESGR